MVNLKKPTLYYIKHPLADGELSQQALATFTDEDCSEYRSEYDEYLNTQHQAVKDMSVLCNECITYIKTIFGEGHDGKQIRYFERNIRNGESFTDQHANKYPQPENVDRKVQEARKKYCSFLGQENAPKVGGEDTLQEINNAVSFLLKRGLSLNTDFTVSNSVSMAKTLASQDFDDSVVSCDEGTTLVQHNVMMLDGTAFPSSSFVVTPKGGNKFSLKSVDITKDYEDWSDEIKGMMDVGASYAVSFVERDEPTFKVC